MSKKQEAIFVSVRGSSATGLVHEEDDVQLEPHVRQRIAEDAARLADELGAFNLKGVRAIQDAMLASAKRAVIAQQKRRHAEN